MHREPDVGLDPGSPGSRPGPKAGTKPLHHPGIPIKCSKETTLISSDGQLTLEEECDFKVDRLTLIEGARPSSIY